MKKSLPETLINALKATFGIESLTEIQEKTLALLEKNAFITAQTGSGKTLAYLLPLLSQLTPNEAKNTLLIVVPTQELALQIREVIESLNQNLKHPFSVEALIGGANINYQLDKLKKKPQILIGTPGRIINLFDKRKINGQTIEYLVFDEIDAMKEKLPLLQKIKKSLRKTTQTLAVTATLTEEGKSLFEPLLPDYQVIESKDTPHLNPNISHYFIYAEQRDKIQVLRQFLSASFGETSLVFLNKPDQIERVYHKLSYHNYPVTALYGDMKKEERKEAMTSFRKGLKPILISSDLTARGVDLPNVTQIIHLDFPLSPLSYIHRAGRTARGIEKNGISIALVGDKEKAAIRIYERDLGLKFQELELYEGEIYLKTDKPKLKKKASKKKSKKVSKKGK